MRHYCLTPLKIVCINYSFRKVSMLLKDSPSLFHSHCVSGKSVPRLLLGKSAIAFSSFIRYATSRERLVVMHSTIEFCPAS